MNPSSKKDAATLPLGHGAISTRKSTEEGLEQEFNALEAQRQSVPAFLPNQAHPGRIARLMTLGTVPVLALTAGKDTTFYQLQALQSDFGVAYRLTKAQRGNSGLTPSATPTATATSTRTATGLSPGSTGIMSSAALTPISRTIGSCESNSPATSSPATGPTAT